MSPKTKERVSKGQAQAIFEAAPTGGRALENHDFRGLGAPGDEERRATIRPLPDEGFDGRHYCAEDWHVIVLADRATGDKKFTKEDFEQLTANDVITFRLDGKPLATSRTATRRLTFPSEDQRGWAFQQGVVLAPQELSVGGHKLEATVTFPPDTSVTAITLFIDAPGTGECL
jgi:hypothetical protein